MDSYGFLPVSAGVPLSIHASVPKSSDNGLSQTVCCTDLLVGPQCGLRVHRN
ncbi:hypothetical protein BDK88_2981 [Natrinema hispanicum]|uniref:Uncharacterized protein n=1 Tax=Natrinema hispanicum TaxID=392421 RepID=A0A482Y7P3_9EURY|nr:hypothetical protein BDK88_2981 [Natrinema hispanicum]